MKWIKALLWISAIAVCTVLVYSEFNPKETRLAAAVEKGDIKAVERMLKKGADPDAYEGRSLTPLNIALMNGDIEMVKLLLKYGADPNAFGELSEAEMAPLTLAVVYSKRPADVLRLLIDAGADPAKDFFALHSAIEKGDLDAVKLLVNGGGDVNQGLQTAAGTNQVEIVKYLLEAGADPNQGVVLAKITHNEEILRLLIEAGASVTE
jgi:ankyrin repeat protein